MDTFVFHEAPLSSVKWPLATSTCYLVSVIALEWYMRVVRRGKGIEGPAMRCVQAGHNVVLCIGSLVMFLGTLKEIILRSTAEPSGAFWMFCESPSAQANGPLFFWSYVYYLSKYYELLDTVLQLLKGRPIPHFFLHTYHHSVVLLMGWAWLEYTVTLQHIGLLVNTAVHVVMYHYFFCKVLGWSTPWKKFVTWFQIVQFMTSIVCLVATLVIMRGGRECAGSRELMYNAVFNVTLLYQFVGVLFTGGRKKVKKV